VSVTTPFPLPAPVTVTVVATKFAVTDCTEFMVTEQAPVPVHAPPQPANAVPAGSALTESETDLPCTYEALQVPPPEPQFKMPAGALETLPPAGPVEFTVKANVGNKAKFAVTVAVDVPTM
jgi:hypothetical protein